MKKTFLTALCISCLFQLASCGKNVQNDAGSTEAATGAAQSPETAVPEVKVTTAESVSVDYDPGTETNKTTFTGAERKTRYKVLPPTN